MTYTKNNSAHSPLEPAVADRLLELLSTDDEFRSLFQTDPAAALAEIGHSTAAQYAGAAPAEGDAFYCMTATRLAPKEEISQSREELKSFLTSYTDHRVIFAFESGQITSTLRRK